MGKGVGPGMRFRTNVGEAEGDVRTPREVAASVGLRLAGARRAPAWLGFVRRRFAPSSSDVWSASSPETIALRGRWWPAGRAVGLWPGGRASSAGGWMNGRTASGRLQAGVAWLRRWGFDAAIAWR